MTVLHAIKLVQDASDPVSLFGPDPVRTYRKLALLLHADTTKATGLTKEKAALAFVRLTELYAQVSGKVKQFREVVVGKWVVGGPVCKGDVADVYRAIPAVVEGVGGREAGGRGAGWVFKVAREEKDWDLMEAEYTNLQALAKAPGWGIGGGGKYLPTIAEHLKLPSKVRANVISECTGMLSLVEVLKIYKHGLDFRHVVWVGNRAWNALAFIHEAGVVHGAVLPEHLMLDPVGHGLKLVDWCYSTAVNGKPIPAIVSARKDMYPREVVRKESPTPQTDIYMLARALLLAANKIPRRFVSFLDHCTAESPRSRPLDAEVLAERWRELARHEYGEPNYVELPIPTVVGAGA